MATKTATVAKQRGEKASDYLRRVKQAEGDAGKESSGAEVTFEDVLAEAEAKLAERTAGIEPEPEPEQTAVEQEDEQDMPKKAVAEVEVEATPDEEVEQPAGAGEVQEAAQRKARRAARAQTRATQKQVAKPPCPMCGHPTAPEQAVVRGLGKKCHARLQAWVDAQYKDAAVGEPKPDLATCTDEQFAELVQMCKDDSPFDAQGATEDLDTKQFVPFPEVREILAAAHKSVSSLMKKAGGERGAKGPDAPYWQLTYANGKRWFPREFVKHLNELGDVRSR